MESLWQKAVELPRFDTLDQNLKTDVLIIGGGIAGVLCAYSLKQAGVDCVLLEARQICSGITKNTTAKIILQHGLIYDKLIRTFGLEAAKLYLRANWSALEQYAELCQTIDCDFQRRDSHVYSMDDMPKACQPPLPQRVLPPPTLAVAAVLCRRPIFYGFVL